MASKTRAGVEVAHLAAMCVLEFIHPTDKFVYIFILIRTFAYQSRTYEY